jgi:hypothetical protein
MIGSSAAVAGIDGIVMLTLSLHHGQFINSNIRVSVIRNK